MQTCNNFQWELNVWKKATGEGQELCSDGFLHCYPSPEIAVLMNPNQADFSYPRIFECECKGESLNNNDLELGFKEMKLTKEIKLPEISIKQKIKIALFCALEVHNEINFLKWVNRWFGKTNENKYTAIDITGVITKTVWGVTAAAKVDIWVAIKDAVIIADAIGYIIHKNNTIDLQAIIEKVLKEIK
jgi:hypothetical protein